MAESFNNVSQNISRDSPFQGKVLSSFPILGNCSGRDVSFHQIWNIEILYVSKRQRQTGKLTQSAKFSTNTYRGHSTYFSRYFKIRAFWIKPAVTRSCVTCLAVWSLPRKFVEAGEFLNWLIPFLKFGGLQKLIVWRARQSFTRNTKHLLRLLKTMKDNLIKFCWNPRLKSLSAAHQLAPTGPGVAPLIDEHIFQFS